MKGTSIGDMARNGEYCDICKKRIYFNIWGHVEMHKRQPQQQEDRRAMRENSARIMERFLSCSWKSN